MKSGNERNNKILGLLENTVHGLACFSVSLILFVILFTEIQLKTKEFDLSSRIFITDKIPNWLWCVLLLVLCIAISKIPQRVKRLSKSIEKWKKYGIFFSLCMIWIAGIHYGLFVMALRIFDRFPLCVFSAIAGSCVVIIICIYIQNIPMISQLLAWWGRNTMKVLCLANIFRAFIWWQGICGEYLHINNIIVMFMLQATIIAIIVCGWNGLQNKRRGNIKRLRMGNE